MKNRRVPSASRTKGIALLIVLAFLVLITGLILAFFLSVTTEVSSANTYSNGATAKQLADSSVQAVMASIRSATTQGPTVAWASQPGMIRTYDNTGNPVAYYKLYSSSNTIVTTAQAVGYNPASEIDQKWDQKAAEYVDLNSPITDGTGGLNFPIVDPRVMTTSSSSIVEGFLYSGSAPGLSGTIDGIQTPPTASNGQRLPMPVSWIYVLADGTLTVPASVDTTGNVANWLVGSVSSPSKSNPIVGRIAFWTDDETSKININTASEGVYWDTPHTRSSFDEGNLALDQPAQNEYQRYPGHPAMTCLSTVLGSLLPQTSGTTNSYNYTQFKPYYGISPRLNDLTIANNEGSKAGTVPVTSGSAAALTIKADRLYASVDELLFQPLNSGSGRTPNVPSVSGSAVLNNSIVEQAKFFLTACSRAPDVNLFNKPRVGIWPINATNNGSYRTLFDQAIAFCGTINQFPYYFQRSDPTNTTVDLPSSAVGVGLGRNRALISYLQYLTGKTLVTIPGFGGNFYSKYGFSGSVNNPGNNGGKAVEQEQILTEIFDYIRSQNINDTSSPAMTNPYAPVSPYANPNNAGDAGKGEVVPIYDNITNTKGFGRFPTLSEMGLMFVCTGWNDGLSGTNSADVNVQPGQLRVSGTGSYPGFTTAIPVPTPNTTGTGQIRVQALLVFNRFDPSQGFPNEHGSYTYQISGLNNFTLNGVSMGFPKLTATSGISAQPADDWGAYTGAGRQSVYDMYFNGGNLGFRSFAMNRKFPPNPGFALYPFVSGTTNILPYTLPGNPSPMNPNPAPMVFNGGAITINIVASNPSVTTPVQTITLNLPGGTFPTPTCAGMFYAGNNDDWYNLGTRLGIGTNSWTVGASFISGQDTVRTVRAWPGDMRMIAGRTVVNGTGAQNGYYDSLETNFPTYFSSAAADRLVHGLIESTCMPFYGAILSQLVPNINYGWSSLHYPNNGNGSGLNQMETYGMAPPSAAASGSASGVFIGKSDGSGNPTTMPGDWDNGEAWVSDGPYINKADEGDVTTTAYGSGGVAYFYMNWDSNATPGQSYFSPNRIMPSAVMFGSLPTGVIQNIPWKTLLFCPNPPAGPSHPGFGTTTTGGGPNGPAAPPFTTPPDHLLLDLFTMPVVEPYPITEPLSTAGRINMNYQIAPFTYITRKTGMRAVLKSERMVAILNSDGQGYKGGYATSSNAMTNGHNYHLPINADQTLAAFDSYFTTNSDIFRSASQICDMFLYPAINADNTATNFTMPDLSGTGVSNWWANYKLTGDNSRERPYATIYPRLTTKSNTFTVHMRVQTLKKANTTAAATWDQIHDVVTGEYRGSQTIERYIDPSDGNLPDFTLATSGTADLGPYYKFRVVSSKQFTP